MRARINVRSSLLFRNANPDRRSRFSVTPLRRRTFGVVKKLLKPTVRPRGKDEKRREIRDSSHRRPRALVYHGLSIPAREYNIKSRITAVTPCATTGRIDETAARRRETKTEMAKYVQKNTNNSSGLRASG